MKEMSYRYHRSQQQRQKLQFRLYRLDCNDWRFTVHGDNLSCVEAELTLRWSYNTGDKEADARRREFQELREYLERECLFAE